MQPRPGRAGPAVSASNLTKVYGATTGLFGIDLAVGSGEVVALLGPNGAGKTTAVRILTTLLKPDAGEVVIGGYDALREPRKVRAIIGIAGQAVSVDDKLSGLENLTMFGRLSRQAEILTGHFMQIVVNVIADMRERGDRVIPENALDMGAISASTRAFSSRGVSMA